MMSRIGLRIEMTKIELIEKISEGSGVPESEQKFFFERLLIRVAEELNEEEFLLVSGLGRFKFKKSFSENENDLLVFITNDNEELIFSIPEREDLTSAEPVDSYFSISIGKKIIPLKDAGESEFFIPQSGDEIKRMIELKVEKFLEDALKSKIEPEDIYDLDDVKFSFLNWKKSTDINEEINKIEQELDESFSSEVQDEQKISEDEFEQLIETEYIPEEEIERNEENLTEETNAAEVTEDFKVESGKTEDLEKANEDFIVKDLKGIEEELKLSEKLIDESIDEQIEAEKISDEVNKGFTSTLPEKEKVEADDSTIKKAFQYTDGKKVRLGKFRKRVYGGLIFTAVIILGAAAVIYFSYYSDKKDKPTTSGLEPKEFNVVIERSYDIPVSYPYQAEMFGGVYDAINKELLKPIVKEESDDGTEIVKVPEIKTPQPTTRIKGYIYQYNDGTYAVQISSWKSRSIAVSETQKYLDVGYDAFVEQTELSGKPYYRVRIGGFKSLAEAENFIQK